MPHTTTPPAPLVLRAGQSRRSYRSLGPGTFGDCLLTCADTGGAFSLFDVTFGPGAGVPPHVHANEDEIFYVLDGQFRFQIGERIIHAGPGACLHGKRGVTHSPLNIGQTPGRMLVVATPGGFERFFDALEDAGLPGEPSPEGLEKMFALLTQYGMQPTAPASPDAAVEIAAAKSGAFAELGDHRGWARVSSTETDGGLLLLDTHVDPRGGVPPHLHAREDETFYLLSGRVAVEVDGRTVEVGQGDVVFAPRHLPHSWQAISDQPARFLLLVTPGINFESFALEMACADVVPSDPDSIATLVALAASHGIEMLPVK